MRTLASAAMAALTIILAGSSAAIAQAPAPSVGSPKAPIPYTALHRKPAAAKPVAHAALAASDAATPAATGSPAAAVEPAKLAPTRTAAVVVPGARLSPGQTLPIPELETFVDGVVRDAMAREHIAGVTVSIVQNGQVLLKKGYGFADLKPERPVDPDRTLFRIGSISKTFTWIALMKEVEAGRMRLNQPINLYLPEKVQVKDQGYDQPVRVSQLMDHSAGFEDRALGQLFERDYDRVRPMDLYLRQERPRRVHAPGAVSSYSNYGATLAGEAVSYTAGKPFERLIEDEILGPLGMAHTTFREPHPAKAGLPAPMPASLAADVSDAYRWTPTGFERRDYEYIGQVAPAGAASSTAGDMARYMLMQLAGGQADGSAIYGPKTAEAFRTALRPGARGVNGWAHGLMIYELPGGHRGFGHGGDTLSFHSNMVMVPDLGLGVFISTNTDTGPSLATQFPERLVREFYAEPHVFPRGGSATLVDERPMYAGYFLSTRRAYSGLEGFVTSLISGVAVDVTSSGTLSTGARDALQTWALDGPAASGRFLSTQGDEPLVFDIVNGQAVAFHPSNGTQLFERAPMWKQPQTLAWLAGLTALAAISTLGGIAARNRREFRENQIQGRAGLIQNIQAILWLSALALFALWVSKTGDLAQIMYRWPGAIMVIASACALVAAALDIITILVLPAIWRGGRRVDSWTHLRKAFFTLTVLIYAAFSIDLALWGALSPWSG